MTYGRIAGMPDSDLTQLWEEHTAHEFSTRDTESTLATMVDDAYVNHVPVLTGGAGKDALRIFYSVDFIPKMPPDTKLTPISRTVGEDQLVDEMIFSFTHTLEMPWMLPGNLAWEGGCGARTMAAACAGVVSRTSRPSQSIWPASRSCI